MDETPTSGVTFPLTGEPLALDLVNTRPPAGDLIAGPAGLTAWLGTQEGRLTPVAEVGTAELAAVHAVREAADAALRAAAAGERPPVAALDALNAAMAGAPAHQELAWTEADGLSVARRRTAGPAARLAAELAEAAAGLLTDPRVTSVRACEAEDCVLLFLPAHPRRRWCVASACGNRTRVARYYARHKADADPS
ncbi:CGNR zinc finger domain-containing protein [Streptomyces sp. NPDC051211]|uniref:CGNR zinc finger domain-containing protein n=1 Tax=Streptomyces sp. NPDC051211 TaxID=3154643 RepID=UPI00344CE410